MATKVDLLISALHGTASGRRWGGGHELVVAGMLILAGSRLDHEALGRWTAGAYEQGVKGKGQVGRCRHAVRKGGQTLDSCSNRRIGIKSQPLPLCLYRHDAIAPAATAGPHRHQRAREVHRWLRHRTSRTSSRPSCT